MYGRSGSDGLFPSFFRIRHRYVSEHTGVRFRHCPALFLCRIVRTGYSRFRSFFKNAVRGRFLVVLVFVFVVFVFVILFSVFIVFVKESFFLRLRLALDVDLILCQMRSQPRVLSFFADGQRQLIVRNDDQCGPVIRVRENRDDLGRG